MVRLLSNYIVSAYSAVIDELSSSFMKIGLILKKKIKLVFIVSNMISDTCIENPMKV